MGVALTVHMVVLLGATHKRSGNALHTAAQPSPKRACSPFFSQSSSSLTPRKAGLSSERKGSFEPLLHPHIPPHTLLLGTQPSDNSLQYSGYYLTNENAFWHIVGDALGFRRGFHIKGRAEAVDSIRPHLLHLPSLNYAQAAEKLTAAGYAVWDIVSLSTRRGSLDSAIRDAQYADVRSLVRAHPTITKICFSTGIQSARRFKQVHAAWLAEGSFRARDDAASGLVFGDLTNAAGSIELCVMESVSPAYNPRQTWSSEKQRQKGFDDEWVLKPAAKYPWKRAQWFEVCFANEPAVMASPKFGTLPTHFRDYDPTLGDRS